MPSHQEPLPENPSLENLKKRTKEFQKRVRAGDAEAVARVHALHPRAADALRDFKLSDAQLVASRLYGFQSWPKLRSHLAVVDRYAWQAPETAPATKADVFTRLACLDYSGWVPSNAEKARQMLDEDPQLARANIYAAAAAGDVDAIRTFIAREPASVNRKGGPLSWAPLLYACYSRIDARDYSTLDAARALLAASADPNAGFLWHGNVPPFTALTGAFGEGEDNPNMPPHPHRDALARLLLDAGADPNDGQALYNRHFNRDDGHLRLLFSYGLGRDVGGPWLGRFEHMQTPSQMLVEELWSAARRGLFDRVKLLVEHGTDVNGRSFRNQRTPYEEARISGHRDVAEYLSQHGAQEIVLDRTDRFVSACLTGDIGEAEALLPVHLEPIGRAELLHRVVDSGRADVVRFLVAHGFEVNGMTHNTVLHDAAINGDLAMVKLLIELGADPTIREPHYNATPLGWAEHGKQQEVIDYLNALTPR